MTAGGIILALLAAGALALGGGDPGPAGPAAEYGERATGLTPGELAGQRLIAGWDGRKPPGGLRRLIRSGGVAGLILFEDNIGSRRSTRRRIDLLQRLPRPAGLEAPLLITVDQEGGQVERLPGPPAASAATMGSRGRSSARLEGQRTGRSLQRWGFNTDLAPTLDVGRPGGAIDSEGRAFGSSPRAVTGVGVEGFAAGLRDTGVAATAKHFPGIGMIETNTDFASQQVSTSKRRLRRRDEPPFRAFARSGGELVMLSLATYEAFSNRPAAMSRKLAERELRERVGFDGVSISDALDATAATSFGPLGKVALATATAGTDLLLYPDWRDARDVRSLFRERLAEGRLDRAGFERSAARVLELRDARAPAGGGQ